MRKKWLTGILIALVLGTGVFLVNQDQNTIPAENSEPRDNTSETPVPTATSMPTPTQAIPQSYVIPQQTHTYQTFNNCGPAALSMQLSYHNINVSQAVLGQDLRPYQNQQGDNDDKSVTLEELAEKAQEFNLVAYHRPAGSVEVMQRLIAEDIPVVIRTWTYPNEDIGHYRLVRGYDTSTQEIIQDDSLQGENLRYSYDYLDSVWKPFNYEYLVIAPPEKDVVIRSILGENADKQQAWQNAYSNLLSQDQNDIYTLFNLSIAAYETGNYEESIAYFEKVEGQLPPRTLWYQIEPIQAYLAVGNYDRVFTITDAILNNGNRAFSELYIVRGKAYQAQGNISAAQEEFRKAVQYNVRNEEAQRLLESVQ